TINGIGERAGNASLEEVVMALRTRSDAFAGYTTGIDTAEIYRASRMVSNLTGLLVQRNKAIVGENAFAHEAGIHQDGVLKHRETYEIMDPRDIGVPDSKLVLGKHSGRAALADRIAALGYSVDADTVTAVYERFKDLADRKKEVYDEDIEALVDRTLDQTRKLWELQGFKVSAGSGETSVAFVRLQDSAGHDSRQAAYGDGPIDACYSAIQLATNIPIVLEDYQTRAITGGKDAQGEVTVTISHHGQRVRGRGLSTDVIEAAIRAYLAAINRLKLADPSQKTVAATTMGDESVDEPKAQMSQP
ncbi:MAG: alpha-isopropylmalate synthase regulatory domain-containing protein, partial [Planctomycetota bacterium]